MTTPFANCILPPPDEALRAMFAPQSVALIGASERPGSVGRALLENLRPFPGELHLINQNHPLVLGRRASPSLAMLGKTVDLAVIATPAATVPGLIKECVDAGVKAAVIISAGFKEVGPEGARLEQQILAEARRNGLRIVGPNCLGIMSPGAGLNATFAPATAQPGRVAFLSQSGALCTAILDWSLTQKVGFSAFVSMGSMLDVGWGDLIRHFGDDPHTSSIIMYMESVGDAARFMEAARLVAARKPIVVIKVGRTAGAAKAAASHTGAMTGSDAVLDAAFRRTGILRVDSIEELFDMAEVLAKQPLPQGPRLGIVTNAGGPGVLAADALAQNGGELARLAPDTLETLSHHLPAAWSHANPVDILGDADAQRYAHAIQAVTADPGIDGLLVMLTPQSMTNPLAVAGSLAQSAPSIAKPVLTSWMGGEAVEAARTVLNSAGIPTYPYPDEAARAFQLMWQRHERLDLLEETNMAACMERQPMGTARELVERLRQDHPVTLSEHDAKRILNATGIPVVPTRHAKTEAEAVALAQAIGFPVVLKLQSPTITHKSDAGGVAVDLGDAEAVRAAWRRIQQAVPAGAFDGVTVQPMIKQRGVELICGLSTDPQFGPVLMVGAGGVWVEMLDDHVLALPPLSPALALHHLSRTRIYRALQGMRHQPPCDLNAVADVLVKLGDLALAVPAITEIDINPLLASPEGVLALDARMVLAPAVR